MSAWRLLDIPAGGAAYNMAVDAVLLRQQGAESPPTVRVYRWAEPAVTVGYSLTAADHVDLAGCESAGVSVTRRLTGGGVVIHDGTLTFSIVAPLPSAELPASAGALHRLAMGRVQVALASIGLVTSLAAADGALDDGPNWCMARAHCCDLVAPGAKIAGGADRRTRTGVLYQGYVHLRPPRHTTLEAAYPTSAGHPVGATPSARGLAEPRVAEDDLAAAIHASFAQAVRPLTASGLTRQERCAVEATARSVFGTREWLGGSRSQRRRLRLVAERSDRETAGRGPESWSAERPQA